MTDNLYIETQKLSKSFGKVKANQNIDFQLKKGEIHAILGENGAGKSTLMNMLSGVYKPDSGFIFIKGKKTKLSSPKDAINHGIGMIHQHHELVDNLTAKENILIGQSKNFFFNKGNASKKIKDISNKYNLPITLNKKVYEMSIGEKQSLEIIKVLYSGADILILDEPTAVLTPQETKKLFKIMKKMASLGCALIIITHKLNEVMEISDRVTVLRKGKSINTLETNKTNTKELTDLMVGQKTDLKIENPKTEIGETILQVKNLTVKNNSTKLLYNINFEINRGEILGVAGVSNSGQKTLCETIAGLQKACEGKIIYENKDITNHKPSDIINRKISMSFIPEDRLGMGLAASLDMVDNYLIKEHYNQNGIFLKRKKVEEKCKNLIKQLSIKTPGIYHPVKELSGGNIQKVLIGREIDTNPHLLITAYAVRGLDINSSHTIYDLLNEQKQKSVGILFIGEDLDTLLGLCDRIMVLSEGEITGIVNTKETTKEEIGFLMAGQKLTDIKKVNKNA
ncbi:MAG: ABC transporter ATP-binding protein [Bacillota bacterium]